MRICSTAFSLIELMIVITIIGILAAVAVPAYQNYVVRANIIDAVTALRTYTIQVAEYYQLNGAWPPDGWSEIHNTSGPAHFSVMHYGNNAAGLNRPFIVGMLANDSKYGGAATKYLSFVGNLNNGTISWQCRTSPTSMGDTLPLELLPASCQCNTAWNVLC